MNAQKDRIAASSSVKSPIASAGFAIVQEFARMPARIYIRFNLIGLPID